MKLYTFVVHYLQMCMKEYDPPFRESISWIISPFKFWTATIFLHAHLQVVYYKCVKFHKIPISSTVSAEIPFFSKIQSFMLIDFIGTIILVSSNNVREHQYRRSNNVREHQYQRWNNERCLTLFHLWYWCSLTLFQLRYWCSLTLFDIISPSVLMNNVKQR
jgi:hypothetical protein